MSSNLNQQLIQGPSATKFDKMFVNSVVQSRKFYQSLISFNFLMVECQIIQLVAVIVFFSQTYLKNIDLDDNAELWIYAMAIIFFDMISCILLRYSLQSLRFLISAAIFTGHLIIEIGAQNPLVPKLQDLTSRVYNAGDPEQPEPTEQIKKKQQQRLSSSIDAFLRLRHSAAVRTRNLCQLGMLTIMIMMIINMADHHVSPETRVFTIIFLVLYGLYCLKIIAALLLICLIPVICVGFCLWVCCVKRPNASAFGQTLNVEDYKPSADPNEPVDCSICFTSFTQGEKVLRLPCNSNHLFHELCIKQWFRVGATCPICRKNFVQPDPAE